MRKIVIQLLHHEIFELNFPTFLHVHAYHLAKHYDIIQFTFNAASHTGSRYQSSSSTFYVTKKKSSCAVADQSAQPISMFLIGAK